MAALVDVERQVRDGTQAFGDRKDEAMGRAKEISKKDLQERAKQSDPWHPGRVTLKMGEVSAYCRWRYGRAIGDELLKEWIEVGKVMPDGSRIHLPLRMLGRWRCILKEELHKFVEAELAFTKSSSAA